MTKTPSSYIHSLTHSFTHSLTHCTPPLPLFLFATQKHEIERTSQIDIRFGAPAAATGQLTGIFRDSVGREEFTRFEVLVRRERTRTRTCRASYHCPASKFQDPVVVNCLLLAARPSPG